MKTKSEEEIEFVDGPVDDTQSTESASVAGSTPTEPETTAEHPTFTQPLPPPATFTIRTITASAQPQPLTTLTPITHSARPLPTTTRDEDDDPGKTKDRDRDRDGKHEKTDSASVTDGFTTVTTSLNSTIAITTPTPTAVFASVTSSVLISATASPAINNGAALQGAQQKGTSSGHMSGGAKAGIAIGVAAGVSMLAIVLFWLIKCFCSRKSEADTESSIRAFLSGGKSSPGDGGLPPPATAAGAGAGHLSSNFDPRSNSQILDELIAASYAHQNGQDSSIPNGYVLPDPTTALDEKQADGAYPVTIIQPAPTHQPEIRKSVASWLRKHHPLKLNPLSIRGSTFSAFSSRRASSAYSSSQQGGGGGGGGGARDSLVSDYPSPTSYDPDAPPLPEIPATYFNEIPKPLSPMPKKLPTAAANMKAMKFQSVWSDSSAGTDMDRSRMTVSTEGNESLFNLYEGGDGQVRVPSQVVTSLSPPPPLMNKDQDQGKDQGQGQRASSPTLRP
ncbi:hypothetical protein NEUTE2DRAFT_153674 [Neurospora tetrasperma FGSC 2509]|nr:hypothetical protein NEUTE2DRAFT_153674 [Neurospora tetrasperma FGSC 2509]